jgi:hypothetical protein
MRIGAKEFACAALLLVAPRAWAQSTSTGIPYEFDWSLTNLASGPVREASGSGTSKSLQFRWPNASTPTSDIPPFWIGGGPADTSSDAQLSASANKRTRKIGGHVRIEVDSQPFDPEDPPPQPLLLDTSAGIGIGLRDRVTPRSTSVGPNGIIKWSVTPPNVDGTLAVPPESDGGGVAVFRANLDVTYPGCTGGTRRGELRFCNIAWSLLNFEKILVSGTGEDAWDAANEPDSFRFEPLILENGTPVVIHFHLYTSAQLVPNLPPEQAADPPASTVHAEFGSTLTWTGVSTFTTEEGTPLTDVTFESEEGIDWINAPEPEGNLALLASAATLSALAVRRRRATERASDGSSPVAVRGSSGRSLRCESSP